MAKGGEISCYGPGCLMWTLFLFALQYLLLNLRLILFTKSSTYGRCDSVTLLYVERLSDHLTSRHTWRDFLLTGADPLSIGLSKRGQGDMWRNFLLPRTQLYVETFPAAW